MEHNYINKYYDFERNHWWFVVREKIIRQQLSASLAGGKFLRILNVGAATGGSTRLLEHYGEVVSVEKDPSACEFLREKLKINVVQASVEALPFEDDFFDVVCIFDVIEHVKEEAAAINELYRVCKKGGRLYCTVPAFSFLWSHHDEVNHHFRRYTKKRIRDIVATKFLVEYQTYFNFFLFLPILLYRFFTRYTAKPEPAGSDFERSKLLNGMAFSFLFKLIFTAETFLLRYFILPFGVSVLIRARK